MLLNKDVSIVSIIYVFLKISFTAFGGHAAHLAMMEEEVVKRRKWMDHQDFLDIISAANLIPGPNSTETALHIGYKLRSWVGFFAAGLSFILPTILIVTGVAIVYVKYGKLAAFENILLCIKPVIMAVISLAIYRFSKSAVKNKLLFIMLCLASLASFFKITEIIVILVTGLLVMLIQSRKHLSPSFLPINFISEILTHSVSCTVSCDLNAIFLFFFKVSSIIFGSGYVLYAFLYNDLVINYGWINQTQLIDAIAIGQFTPGPVFTAATFIGYLLAGVPGALVASLAVFLPAFIYVAISSPFLGRMRESKYLAHFLDGVNVASLGLMLVVCLSLAQNILSSAFSIIFFFINLLILLRFKINSAWLILLALALGLIMCYV